LLQQRELILAQVAANQEKVVSLMPNHQLCDFHTKLLRIHNCLS